MVLEGVGTRVSYLLGGRNLILPPGVAGHITPSSPVGGQLLGASVGALIRRPNGQEAVLVEISGARYEPSTRLDELEIRRALDRMAWPGDRDRHRCAICNRYAPGGDCPRCDCLAERIAELLVAGAIRDVARILVDEPPTAALIRTKGAEVEAELETLADQVRRQKQALAIERASVSREREALERRLAEHDHELAEELAAIASRVKAAKPSSGFLGIQIGETDTRGKLDAVSHELEELGRKLSES